MNPRITISKKLHKLLLSEAKKTKLTIREILDSICMDKKVKVKLGK